MQTEEEKISRIAEKVALRIVKIYGNGGGGTSSAIESWVSENFLSIEFFSNLFKAYGPAETEGDPDIEILPNDTQSTISNIKAMFGFWTEQYVSALGQNPDGGGGSVVLNACLSSINASALGVPTGVNTGLIFNGNTWVYREMNDINMSAVWQALGASTSEQINISHLTDALVNYATASDVGTLQGYFTNGQANSALEADTLATARTIWGQSFDGSANITGNMTGVTNIDALLYFDTTNSRIGVIQQTPAYTLDVTGTLRLTGAATFGSTMTVTGLITANGGITIPSGQSLTIGDAVITWDATAHGIKITKGLYSETFISALGAGSTGSGGVDMTTVWQALAASTSEQINASHLTGALSGYATQSWVLSQIGGGGYVDSITVGTTNYTPVSGVVTLPAYPSLTGYATESWVTSQGYATESWVTSQDYASASDVSTLQGYFTNGKANSALEADTLATARTIWGQSFDGSANITGNMTGVTNIDALLYFDTTNSRIGVIQQTPAYTLDVTGTMRLTGAATFGSTMTVTGLITANGGITIPSGQSLTIGDAVITWDATHDGIKITKGLYSETFISALGAGNTGSSGVDMATVWQALAASTSEQINVSHLTTALSTYATQSYVSTYVSNNLALYNLSDVDVSGATNGMFLKFNGQKWVAATASGTGSVNSITIGSGGTNYTPDSSGIVTLPAYPDVSTYMPKSGGTFTGSIFLPSSYVIIGTSTGEQGKLLYVSGDAKVTGSLTIGSSTAATQSWVTNQGYVTSSGVTSVTIGSGGTNYTPNTNGVVTIPAYPDVSTYMPKSGGTFTGSIFTSSSAYVVIGASSGEQGKNLYVSGDAKITGSLTIGSSTAATQAWVTNKGYVTSSGVTSVATGTGLTGGTITSTGTISINSTYQTYISHGESAYNSLSNYLPLSGGTLSNANFGAQLTIYRTDSSSTYAAICFKNKGGVLAYLGLPDVDGYFRRVAGSNTNNIYTILDSQNSSVSKSGDTLTVKINGTSYSLTNTDHTYNFVGIAFYSGNSGNAEHDCNNAVKNGHYYYSSNGPSTSIGATTNDGALYVQSYSDIWVGQIAQDYRNGRLFVRGKKDGTWQSWVRVANYGEIPTNNNQLTNGAGYITSSGSCASAAACTGNSATATALSFERVSDMHATTGWRVFTLNNSSPTNGPSSSGWAQGITLLPNNDTGGYRHVLTFWGTDKDNHLWIQNQWNGTWGSWKQVLDTGNYTSYTVKKDGTGASGSWGISVTGSSASCTGNAASATKLQTSRTIWGQSFNGTGNIEGTLYLNKSGNKNYGRISFYNSSFYTWYFYMSPTASYDSANSACPTGGSVPSGNFVTTWGLRSLIESVSGYGWTWESCSNSSSANPSIKMELSSNTGNLYVAGNVCSGGNVGIGTASPSYKLHVSGTFYASGNSSIGGTFGVTGATTLSSTLGVSGVATMSNGLKVGDIYFECNSSGAYDSGRDREINTYSGNMHLQYNSAKNLTLCFGGGNVAIGNNSPSYKLHVSGDVYATGGVTCLSDARKKDVICELPMKVEDVAGAPAIRFLWKDNRKDGNQAGTLAQYWQKVLPEVITDKSGELSMQYGVAALVSAIVTARKVVDHERRIRELESENMRLRNEVEQLKTA